MTGTILQAIQELSTEELGMLVDQLKSLENFYRVMRQVMEAELRDRAYTGRMDFEPGF